MTQQSLQLAGPKVVDPYWQDTDGQVAGRCPFRRPQPEDRVVVDDRVWIVHGVSERSVYFTSPPSSSAQQLTREAWAARRDPRRYPRPGDRVVLGTGFEGLVTAVKRTRVWYRHEQDLDGPPHSMARDTWRALVRPVEEGS